VTLALPPTFIRQIRDGAVTLTAAQLRLLFTGMQWANMVGTAQEWLHSMSRFRNYSTEK
jgi:hypothetical protein